MAGFMAESIYGVFRDGDTFWPTSVAIMQVSQLRLHVALEGSETGQSIKPPSSMGY